VLRLFVASIMTLLLASAVPRGALAQTAESAHANPPSYEQAIRQAVDEYSLGHWTEARVFFARAHAIHPNARTLRGLGLSCYESRHYVEALGYLEPALRSQVQPLTAAMRSDLARVVAQAHASVGRLSLAAQPSDARVELDGQLVQVRAGQPLWLDPGEHELQLSAAGFAPLTRSIQAAAGDDIRLQLELEPGALPELNAQLAPAADAPAAVSGAGQAASLVVSAGALLVVVGGVLVGVAAADRASVQHPGERATWNDVQSAYHRGRTFFPLGFTLAGVGVAGIAAGLTWKFWPASREREVTLRVSPLALQLAGRL
jgi:PEGA domain